jgi:PEP-CTERM motif
LTFGANETLTLQSGGLSSITLTSGTTSFTLDVSSSWTGYSSTGLSYWLQVPTSVASSFSLTNGTYFSPFSDANQTAPSTVLFNDSTAADGASSGFTIETRTLGGIVPIGAPNATAGTYQNMSMTVNLNGLAPGTYTLESTISGSRPSQQIDDSFHGNNFPLSTFTITVVPEPATLSLLGLGGLGSFGLTLLRARRRG